MSDDREYVLGQSDRAARRLALQDAQFGPASELLLDELALDPSARVVEFGCGPGGFSGRILKRLGPTGALIGVDSSADLLAIAARVGGPRFEPVRADLAALGTWLDGANVVVGRAVLHHVPMAEILLGRLYHRLRPGTRIAFLEPDFRSPLGLLGAGGEAWEPLRVWSMVLNDLYQLRRLSPAVGATLAATLTSARYRVTHTGWTPCPTDPSMIENMSMFYDEVGARIVDLGLLPAADLSRQKLQLAALPTVDLPPAWGMFRVVAERE